MANGRVLTGFSKPYVAEYSASGNTVTYANGMSLARGVSVSLSVEASDDNIFYADNVSAETAPGTFTGGECSLTVDGLLDAAAKLIYGLPEAGSDGFTHYGKSANPPYVGIGFVCRYMSGGVESFVPVVLPKCRFQAAGLDAATQEEEIEWQTQELTATIMRDDTANEDWKWIGAGVATETAAEDAIKTALNI